MILRAKKTRREHSGKENALEEVTKPRTQRLNADIPIALHRKLKAHAAERGQTMSDVLIALLEEHLSKNSNE